MKFLFIKLYNFLLSLLLFLILLYTIYNVSSYILLECVPNEYCCGDINDDIDRSIDAMNNLQDQLEVITDQIKQLSSKYGHNTDKWPEGRELFDQKIQINEEISRLERRVEWLINFQEDISNKDVSDYTRNSKKNLKRNMGTSQEEDPINSKKR